MSMYLPQTLENLARLGANITIEDSTYLPQTLNNLALLVKQNGGHLTISGSYLPQTLENLARIAGNKLTIVVRKN
jgi:hypothetical protein